MSALAGLLLALFAFMVFYVVMWIAGARRARTAPDAPPEATKGGVP